MLPDTKVAARTDGFDMHGPATIELLERAQEADAADQSLTIRQALRKYPKAVGWAMLLSAALIMEGFDLVTINSFYGQRQFKARFGTIIDPVTGDKSISAAWQSGLSNSALVGQLCGLMIAAFAQDRFGNRATYMFFMVVMAAAIFIPVFSVSLPMLAAGEAICGVPWGVFQTLSTAYAVEVVPTVLRPYVTAYVCMCWGAGITISSGVVRAVVSIDGEWGWRLPFTLQWFWPIPLFLVAYFAPESPWQAVRRGNIDVARNSVRRLRNMEEDFTERDVEATVAYIQHVTALERAETAGATFFDCFKGIHRRRTEINAVVWAYQILCGNAILGFSIVFLQAAGFSDIQSFNLNIGLSCCYIIGGLICWVFMSRFGRATIYMVGGALMFICLIITGALHYVPGKGAQMGVGILLVVQTLINMSTIGPACYPIVAETPSGRLRYKTIVIGRFVYNLTGLFSNSVTPRMVNDSAWGWGARAAWFYAGTNLLCLIWCWFRLPETKDRSFGEIDLLFENKISARKFRTTQVDQFAPLHNAEEKKLEVDHVEHAVGNPMSLNV